MLRALDEERRSRRGFGDLTEFAGRVTRRSSLDGKRCSVDFAELDDANADEEILAQVRHYTGLGASFEWKVYSHDRPSDLGFRLERAGFTRGAEEAVMVLGTGERIWEDPQNIRQVRTSTDLDDFRYVAEQVFAKDYSLTTREIAEAIKSVNSDHVAFVAYDTHSVPVSVGRVYSSDDSVIAGLYGGGTLPAFRGQGFYRAILAARARFAAERGSKYLLVDALPTSRPILERLGFERISSTWPFIYRV